MSDTVKFFTITSPTIEAESGCIYANDGNQMKLTLQFVALDANGDPVSLGSRTDLRDSIWLIDYNATSVDQHLSDDKNWAVDTEPGMFYAYPSESTLATPVSSEQHDTVTSIDFYVRTGHYVKSVRIGWVIKTDDGSIYTCSSQQLGPSSVAPNYTSPAAFSLLQQVSYTMDNCKVTVDDQTLHTNDNSHQGWIHSLQMDHSKEGVPQGAFIRDLRFNNWTFTINPKISGNTPYYYLNYWRLDRYGDNSGRWWMTFQLSEGESGNWDFWYKGCDMCTIPYNLDGSAVTSVYYWHNNGMPVYSQDTGDNSPPQFTMFDQFGNWGNFVIENQDGGENGYLVYKSA